MCHILWVDDFIKNNSKIFQLLIDKLEMLSASTVSVNNLIIVGVVMVIAIIIGVMWNSNYQEIATIRDQNNLQLTISDCKALFDEGDELNACLDKSIRAFGTPEQIAQWELEYFSP